MKTIRKLSSDEMKRYTESGAQTEHITHRTDRLTRYNTGTPLDAFEVDNNHRHGTEIHIIDTKGFICVYNTKTAKHITTMSGRPAQIKRYYRDLNIRYSAQIAQAIRIAYIRNEATGANHF